VHAQLPRTDATLLVRLARLRLLLACDNQRAARRELKALSAAAPGWPEAALARARLEMQRGNYRRCLKLLTGLLQVRCRTGMRDGSAVWC
jgi:uncharacterized protein HemY